MMSGRGIESAFRGPILLNPSVKSFRGGSPCAAAWFGLWPGLVPPPREGLTDDGVRMFCLLRTSCWRALLMSSTMLL